MKNLFKLSQNSKGQGVMEYMIITSLVGIVCLVAIKSFGSKVEKYMNNSSKYLDKQITVRKIN